MFLLNRVLSSDVWFPMGGPNHRDDFEWANGAALQPVDFSKNASIVQSSAYLFVYIRKHRAL